MVITKRTSGSAHSTSSSAKDDENSRTDHIGGEMALPIPGMRRGMPTLLIAQRLRFFYGFLSFLAICMAGFGIAEITIWLTGNASVVSPTGAGMLTIGGVVLLLEFYSAYRIDFPRT
jgi:hypothetical protein